MSVYPAAQSQRVFLGVSSMQPLHNTARVYCRTLHPDNAYAWQHLCTTMVTITMQHFHYLVIKVHTRYRPLLCTCLNMFSPRSAAISSFRALSSSA